MKHTSIAVFAALLSFASASALSVAAFAQTTPNPAATAPGAAASTTTAAPDTTTGTMPGASTMPMEKMEHGHGMGMSGQGHPGMQGHQGMQGHPGPMMGGDKSDGEK